MVEIADALGESADAAQFAAQAKEAKAKYHAAYYNATAGCYSPSSQDNWRCPQTAAIMPLVLDAVPESMVAGVVEGLRQSLVRVGMGIVGCTHVFDTLRRFGLDAKIVELLVQDAYPSLGYMVSQGATTLWEQWEGTATSHVSSRNHIMFGGGVGTITHTALAGLSTAAGGWQQVLVSPAGAAVEELGWASASHESRFGTNRVAWSYSSEGRLELNATLPAGVNGTVEVPMVGGADAATVVVREGAAEVWANGAFVPGVAGVAGAAVVRRGNASEVVAFTVASGVYAFEVVRVSGAA